VHETNLPSPFLHSAANASVSYAKLTFSSVSGNLDCKTDTLTQVSGNDYTFKVNGAISNVFCYKDVFAIKAQDGKVIQPLQSQCFS
jgi:hypothetical protein